MTKDDEMSDEDKDLIQQATLILDATSVQLWELAEMDKVRVTIIPFKNLGPIHLPKSKDRT